MKIEMKHTYNCSADTFWNDIFFEEGYNQELYTQALGMAVFDVFEEERGDDGSYSRKLKAEPKMEVPRVLKKLLGDGTGYVEEGSYDPAKKIWSFEVIPAKLASKITIKGKLWAEPIDDSSCKRICECDITVKIFGVGGAMEKFLKKQFVENYDKAAEFTNTWIEDQDL